MIAAATAPGANAAAPAPFWEGDGTLGDRLGFSTDDLATLYRMGHTFHTNGMLADAEQVFSVLCVLDHRVGHYWLALGAARHGQGKFGQAAPAFDQAAKYSSGEEADQARRYQAECEAALDRPTYPMQESVQ